MSALGSAVSPSGESGSVTTVMPLPDQIPDNPSTLKANTSIETIQNVMYENWIWRNTFQIDPSMRPGHVFGSIKIHPKNCNEYITHISQMFLSWTGSFKIRSRFMATFQFGGSVRVGFLPPRFTQKQVSELPITTLTAYPNVDLDPKNTDWVHFQASDERNILFHWMQDLSAEAPEDFAGWFVFYVAAPIVISGGSSPSISMLVESAGSFNFSQLAPLASIAPITRGWLTGVGTDVLKHYGCDDWTSDYGNMAIQILPQSVHTLLAGFTLAKGVGRYSSSMTPGAVTNAAVTNARIHVENGATVNVSVQGRSHLNWENSLVEIYQANAEHLLALNYEVDALTHDSIYLVAHPEGIHRTPFRMTNRIIKDGFVAGTGPTDKFFGPEGDLSTTLDLSWNNGVIPISQAKLGWQDSGVAIGLPNMCPAESILTFVNFETRTINLNTKQISDHIGKLPAPDMAISQLYNVYIDGTEGPVLLVRMQPNGMFTTNPVAADTLMHDLALSGAVRFEYLQDLSMSSPLPALPTLYRKRLQGMTKATRKNYSAEQLKTYFSTF